MNKKICLLLVLLLLSVTAVAGAAGMPASWSQELTAAGLGITEFNEAPSLRELVEKGDLPPVEERLPVPEDIPVVEPVERIGTYGGTITSAAIGPNSWSDGDYGRIPVMFFTDAEVSTTLGDIAKGYTFENDNKELTIHLRRGLKWSDGHPFTVDDILFWWEDMAHDPEISHWTKWNWYVEGIKPEFVKIDDYNLKIIFPKSNPTIINAVLRSWPSQQGFFFQPAHYIKQFHKKYNPEVVEIAREKGFETWVQYFEDRQQVGPGQQNPDLPVLGPWMLTSVDTTQKVYERNPYYFAVDTEGNQLPYVDKRVIKIMSDAEVAKLDVLQGNLDIAGRILAVGEFAMYKQNEERGGYNLYAWYSTDTSQIAIAFNQNHPDPVKRKVFQDVRFRQAMSLAIDRHEINDLVYNGLAEPTQATVHPGAPYFEEWWAETYAEFDPERAKQLLDEMGLKVGRDGYRVTEDGNVFIIDFQYPTPGSIGGTAELGKIAELLKAYWEEVGVRVNLKSISRELYEERSAGAMHDVGVWPINTLRDPSPSIPASQFDMGDAGLSWGAEWDQWRLWRDWDRGGRQGEEPAQGEEPPQHIKDLMALTERWQRASTEEEFNELAKEYWTFYAEQLYVIGTVARAMVPVTVAKDIGNIPERAPFSDPTSYWKITHPEQWYKTE